MLHNIHLSIYDADHKRIFNLIVILALAPVSTLLWGLHGFISGQSHFSRSNHRRLWFSQGIVALLVIALARRQEGFTTNGDDKNEDAHKHSKVEARI